MKNKKQISRDELCEIADYLGRLEEEGKSLNEMLSASKIKRANKKTMQHQLHMFSFYHANLKNLSKRIQRYFNFEFEPGYDEIVYPVKGDKND
tara:strand:+ start:485 stop:763 length:279 start_codon:yes stop_codon:yes gene_type:complete